MSGQLTFSPTLPESIISTDALESVGAVYVGDAYSADEVVPRRNRQELMLSGSHFAQKWVTGAPLVAGDLLSILGSFYAATLVLAALSGYAAPASFLLEGIVVAGVFIGIGLFSGLYPATGTSPVFELKQSVQTTWIAFGTLIFAEKTLANLSLTEFMGALIGGLIASVTLPVVRNSVRHLCAKTRWWGERALVVGTGAQARAIFRYYQRVPQRGLRPIGVVGTGDLEQEPPASLLQYAIPVLGSTCDISNLISKYHTHWGIIAPDNRDRSQFSDSLKYCGSFRHVIAIPAGVSLPSLWTSSRECAGVSGFYVRDHLRDPISRVLKRTIDIVGAITGLLISAPLFLIAILWIKKRSPGPVFYCQERVGRRGEIFRAWKFRTMVVNADEVLEEYLESSLTLREEWMTYQKLKRDPRVIPGVGNFLRRSSLDELPQLWNILKGDMSLVGPRPCMRNQIDLYGDIFPAYLRVRPGLTGLWQVSGRNHTSYDERVKFDLYYVCNWSFWLDAYILQRTVRTILFREGAY